MNHWKHIPLADYKGHMALFTVGQARMLAAELAAAVSRFSPRSMALLGCAGGNGLDALVDEMLTRLVCVDINSSYIDALEERFRGRFQNLECHVTEIEQLTIEGEVDLVFGGVIFEYTRLGEALRSVSKLLARWQNVHRGRANAG
ncbi:MAG TPA: class I SAM-dependent methyltransferase [Chthoniobacterales bacterium]|jgi:trans-aconitate methyltransferase